MVATGLMVPKISPWASPTSSAKARSVIDIRLATTSSGRTPDTGQGRERGADGDPGLQTGVAHAFHHTVDDGGAAGGQRQRPDPDHPGVPEPVLPRAAGSVPFTDPGHAAQATAARASGRVKAPA